MQPKVKISRNWKYLYDSHTTYCAANIHGVKSAINNAVKSHRRQMMRKTFSCSHHQLNTGLSYEAKANRIKITTFREDDTDYCLIELLAE